MLVPLAITSGFVVAFVVVVVVVVMIVIVAVATGVTLVNHFSQKVTITTRKNNLIYCE